MHCDAQPRERTCHAGLLELKAVYDWVRIYEEFWTGILDALGEFLDDRSTE